MRVTASKVGLLSYCAWWARADAEHDPYHSSPAAERGNRFHAAIERYTVAAERSREQVADDIRDEYDHATHWIDAWEPVGVMSAEVAMGWDPAIDASTRYDVTGRGYPRDGLLHGTADLIVIDARDRELHIYDWKTGSGSEAGPQLRALGLMAARLYGRESVRVAALEATAGGVREVCVETLDAFALAGIAGDLAEQIAIIDTAEPRPGSHCGELYCPARLSCPLGTAATAELVDVIPADSLVRSKPYRLTDPITTPEHAAWALDVCRLVTAKAEAIKDSIKALVPEGGWPLADGGVLRETKATIQAFDKHKAVALCKQLGATDAQIAALHYSFEKSNGLRVSGGSAKPRAKRGPRAA